MGCFHDIFPHSLNFPTESCIAPIADVSAFGCIQEIHLNLLNSFFLKRILVCFLTH